VKQCVIILCAESVLLDFKRIQCNTVETLEIGIPISGRSSIYITKMSSSVVSYHLFISISAIGELCALLHNFSLVHSRISLKFINAPLSSSVKFFRASSYHFHGVKRSRCLWEVGQG
jgi:hypothetical protein